MKPIDATPLLGAALTVVLLASCNSSVSSAADSVAEASTERSEVSEIVVRYAPQAPASTAGGNAWGTQCVSRPYQHRLLAGRAIGGGMQVVLVEPPVSANVARAIAAQIERCPHIEWAEADVVQLSVS